LAGWRFMRCPFLSAVVGFRLLRLSWKCCQEPHEPFDCSGWVRWQRKVAAFRRAECECQPHHRHQAVVRLLQFVVRACVLMCVRVWLLKRVGASVDARVRTGRGVHRCPVPPLPRPAARVDMQESANSMWLAKNTRKCPACHCNIEKAEGCNHMKCRRCRCVHALVLAPPPAGGPLGVGVGGPLRCASRCSFVWDITLLLGCVVPTTAISSAGSACGHGASTMTTPEGSSRVCWRRRGAGFLCGGCRCVARVAALTPQASPLNRCVRLPLLALTRALCSGWTSPGSGLWPSPLHSPPPSPHPRPPFPV
jgi:hypothetical protein